MKIRALPTHALGALLLCLVAVGLLSRTPRWSAGTGGAEYRPPLLPRLEFLRVIGAGQRSLVADYFWLQTVQAVGAARNADGYRDVFYYADLVTDLDPQFHYVYLFTGTAIPSNLGRETWVNTAEARKILEKGVARFPEDVRLRINLAFNLSYFHGDYAKAAELLAETARMPGVGSFVAPLATRLYAQSGKFESALAIARSLREGAEDPETRELYDLRIKQIQLERILQRVDEAVRQYKERTGRQLEGPEGVTELVRTGALPSLPPDPLGGSIVIGPDGRGRSTATEERLEMHDPRKKLEPLPSTP